MTPGIIPGVTAGGEAFEVRYESGAYLLDEAILRLEDDVLNVQRTGPRLVHAVGELRVDRLDDLPQTGLHFDRNFHHVAFEQAFDLFESLVERVAEGSARRFLAAQLVEPLVLLVDHPERVSEHGLPLAQQVERRHAACRPASAAAGNFPFLRVRLGPLPPPIYGANCFNPVPDIGLAHPSASVTDCQAICYTQPQDGRYLFFVVSFPSPVVAQGHKN